MTLLQQLQQAAQNARKGLPASITVEADGVQYTRNFLPRERLILLGGGNIAQPLCQYASDLGFDVVVVDDRPSFANAVRFPEASRILCDLFPAAIAQLAVQENDYVAVITRGHRYDADCLRVLLRGTLPRYLGMIGSLGDRGIIRPIWVWRKLLPGEAPIATTPAAEPMISRLPPTPAQ